VKKKYSKNRLKTIFHPKIPKILITLKNFNDNLTKEKRKILVYFFQWKQRGGFHREVKEY